MTEGQENIGTALTSQVNHWRRHYAKDERYSRIFLKQPIGNDKKSIEFRSMEQVLFASNLDRLNIPKDSGPEMTESCQAVVQTMMELNPEAFARWIDKYEHPYTFSTDHRDRRVRMMVEMGKRELEKMKKDQGLASEP